MIDRFDVAALGETMGLFEATSVGRLRSGVGFELRVGGAESNVAIGIARLGGAAVWMGRLGMDALGDEVVRVLRGEGVATRVRRDAELPTGLMVKERRTPLHQRITYFRRGGAGSALRPEDIDLGALRTARVLHITGITPALSPSARDAVLVAVAAAHDAGVLVSFDVNYRESLWESRATAADALMSLACDSDLVFAGAEETRLLGLPVDPAQAATELASRTGADVVVTAGASGAVSTVAGRLHSADAAAVPVVDTVGAGDAFVAGYLMGLLEGAEPRERLRRACVSGAFACMSAGDWEGAPTLGDLALLARTDPVQR